MTVTLHLGDCLEFMRTLPNGCVDAVVTDPPYQMRGGGGVVPIMGHGVAARRSDSYCVGEPWGYSLDWLDRVTALKPKHVMVFCNSYMLGAICSKLEQAMLIGAVFVWHKPNAAPNCRNTPKWDCEFIVWAKAGDATNIRAKEFRSQILEVPFPQAGCFASERILRPETKCAAHPTQKPLAVVSPFIERLTEPNWIVFDPFAGTGTTGVACVQTGRNFIGCEIDPTYFEIAKRRIEQAQAQMALPLGEAQLETAT